jgi:hypothetical protein
VAQRRYPANWDRIQRAIKLRADFRCECGSFWDCGTNNHTSRCQNREGNRYPHNKRLIALRVVQIGPEDDFRPEYLVALCLPCLRVYEQRMEARASRTEQVDGLFEPTREETKTHVREQN